MNIVGSCVFTLQRCLCSCWLQFVFPVLVLPPPATNMADRGGAAVEEVADQDMETKDAADDSLPRRDGAPEDVDSDEQEQYTGWQYKRKECDNDFLERYGNRFVFQCIEMKEDANGKVEFTHEPMTLKLFSEGYVSTDDQGSRKHGNWRARSDGDCLIIEFRSVKNSTTKYPYTFLRVGPEAGTWISNKVGAYQAILMNKA
jgi:hypothetical protein